MSAPDITSTFIEAFLGAQLPKRVAPAPARTAEELLSLLEGMSEAVIESPAGDMLYQGPHVTVQVVATYFDVSESTARKFLYTMRDQGVVSITNVMDPNTGQHRLWITPTGSSHG